MTPDLETLAPGYEFFGRLAESPIDLGWVAGIIEGEGSISVRSGNKNAAWVTVRVSMVDEDIVRRLAALVGHGTVRPVKPLQPRYQVQHVWTLAARDKVLDFLPLIRPLMGARRTRKIDEAITYLVTHPTPCKTGSFNKNASLTEAKVLEIRAAEGKRPALKLAAEYGVVYQTIYSIWRRESWTHVA